MGTFDDLIPKEGQRASAGTFSDLIPKPSEPVQDDTLLDAMGYGNKPVEDAVNPNLLRLAVGKDREETTGESVVRHLTGGHIDFRPPPPPEVDIVDGRQVITPPESAAHGYFDDPVTALAFGAMGGIKAAGPVLSKVGRGLQETLGWATGGLSDVPRIVGGGAKGIVKAVEAKNLAKDAMKRAEKGGFASVSPEAKITTEAIEQGVDIAPKAVSGIEKNIPEPKGVDVAMPLPEKAGLDTLAETQRLEAQRGSVSMGGQTKTATPLHNFDNPETEALFKSAQGIKPESVLTQTKDALQNIGHKFSREYQHLPKDGEFAELRFGLKKLDKQKDVVADISARDVGEITSTLDKQSYEVFSRKVVLDDLQHGVDSGLYDGKNLPFKLTPESLALERQKLDTAVLADPKLQEALAKRQRSWETLKKDYTDAMADIGVDVSNRFNNEAYFRHQVLEYTNSKGLFGAGKMKAPTNRGYLKERTGYDGLYNTDYLQSEHTAMAQMRYDMELARTLKGIQKNYDISASVREIAKKSGIPDWKKAIPEGYTTWQPRDGNLFYQVNTVPEKIAREIMDGTLEDITKLSESMKNTLAVGGKRKEWVVKKEIADTLNELEKTTKEGAFLGLDKKVLTGWKQWQLVSPRRWFKYNARNLTGDAEGAFLGNPSGFSKTPQAIKEIYQTMVQKKPMTAEMAEWFSRGGMSSTLQAQEMGELKNIWMFSGIYEKTGKNIPKALWNKYWKAARMTTDGREAILRYANYLDYLEQMKASGGTPKNFGASKPQEIMGLKDIRDRAFWLSNDLLGAYDRVSVAGQSIREHLIPFWSWQEVNMKRYVQLFRNAANDGHLTATIGKSLGAKTALAARKVGQLAVKATAFASALQAYNNLVFPELEKQLTEEERARPHVILGRGDDGRVNHFNRMGALDDFLSWFGLDHAPGFVGDLIAGRGTVKELLKKQAKVIEEDAPYAPVNKVVGGAMPFFKTGVELATRRSLYPDVAKPSTIRDKGLYLAKSFGLENEYKAVAGLPSEGYARSVKNAFVYSIDPGEAAYRDAYDIKSDFMKKIGKTSEGFWLTPKGDALYNTKLAIKYNDKKALNKYLREYARLGGTPKGMAESIKAMHPLAGIDKQYLPAFIQSLKPEENKRLGQAIQWYEKTMLGKKQKGE
jgi:hypothetical protein